MELAAADASAASEPNVFSDLPECLLHDILSLALSSMGARRLVQTSALSRRWRHLWRQARCLDVGPQEFGQEGAGDDPEKWARFNDIADSLILQHSTIDLDALRMQVVGPPLDPVELRSCRPDGSSWVHRYLARYRPAVLDIRSHSPGGAHVELRGMSDDGTVLRRLTTLRLTGLRLCDGFERLLGAAGCPLLEHLELRDCLIGFEEEVVASRTLKTLVVDSSNRRMNEPRLRPWHTPRIVAPGLASLELVLLQCYVELWEFEMPSLAEATVRLGTPGIFDEFRLLCSLTTVTKLEISSFPSLRSVMGSRDGRDSPEFHNLTTLILDECNFTRDTPTLLEYFLRHAPNLEKLTLQNCKHPPRSERPAEGSKSSKMSSYHLNLKFVEIKNRKKDGDGCEIIEYLLRVSKNLQRSDIVLSEGPEKPWYQVALAAQGWYKQFGRLHTS